MLECVRNYAQVLKNLALISKIVNETFLLIADNIVVEDSILTNLVVGQ